MTAQKRRFFAAIAGLNDRLAAQRILREKGWSNSAAAPVLGVSRALLSRALHGQRDSSRLLKLIPTLPERN